MEKSCWKFPRARGVSLSGCHTPRESFSSLLSQKLSMFYDRFAQLSSRVFFSFFLLRSFLEIISFNCFPGFSFEKRKRKGYICKKRLPTVALTLWFSRFVIFTTVAESLSRTCLFRCASSTISCTLYFINLFKIFHREASLWNSYPCIVERLRDQFY